MTDRAAITASYQRIQKWVRKTPIVEMEPGAFGVDHPMTLKLEQLQRSGSFKIRGAFNNLLAGDLPEPGVVAISGGNHGAAVALAATQLGAASRVYVPAQIAIEVKLERMRRFGAEVVVAQGSVDQAMAEYEAYAKTNGALAVHPYGSPETITGQGTVGLEFEDQAPDLDTVLVAVGGGGLIGGVASWYAGRVKIVAVETTGTNTLDRTLQGTLTPDFRVSGISASGLGAASIGALPMDIIRAHVAENVVVTDADVFEAQRRLWSATRMIAEPGGVTALAALTSGVYVPAKGEKIGVLVCGGNADPDWFLHEGAA